jgi:endonuclease-3
LFINNSVLLRRHAVFYWEISSFFLSQSVINWGKGCDEMEEKVLTIIDILKQHYPDPVCALHYSKDYELMIAVRLSAQCTDARVNLVTPALFAAYPTLEAMANAPISHIEELVHSCGFYKHKARDIVLACQMLISDYDSKVPDSMEELLKLPGVGRKTANLLLGDLYAQPGSVVCDTHCIRICGRLGLSQGKDPEKVERQLRAILPPEESSDFCHRVVLFGRDICTARNPQCGKCPLRPWCKEFYSEEKE